MRVVIGGKPGGPTRAYRKKIIEIPPFCVIKVTF